MFSRNKPKRFLLVEHIGFSESILQVFIQSVFRETIKQRQVKKRTTKSPKVSIKVLLCFRSFESPNPLSSSEKFSTPQENRNLEFNVFKVDSLIFRQDVKMGIEIRFFLYFPQFTKNCQAQAGAIQSFVS